MPFSLGCQLQLLANQLLLLALQGWEESWESWFLGHLGQIIYYWLMLQSSYKLSRVNFENELELDNDLDFCNTQYPFPNDLEIHHRYKSFRTIFEFSGSELPEHYTKKLSLLNRIHHTIKLKQIKREELTPDTQPTRFIRYLLYYEPVPFSLAFARQHSSFLPPVNIQHILHQIAKDLIDLSLFCELAASHCGFTESGEFRVFIPPSVVLNERKLYTTDKQAIMSSAERLVRFWQSQAQRPRELQPGLPRSSYRFNSPQAKKETQDDNIDVKKTIKLPKNYQKDSSNYQKEVNFEKEANYHKEGGIQKDNNNCLKEGLSSRAAQEGKTHELKKHKSMESLQYDEREGEKPKRNQRKGYQYLSKIEEINKKISALRTAIKVKKNSMEQVRRTDPPPRILPQVSYSPQDHYKYLEESNEGEVIFDKYQDFPPSPHRRGPPNLPTKHQQAVETQSRGESLDTYQQEMGRDFNFMGFQPSARLRKTTQPVLEKLRNKEVKSSESNWHHESAGNRVLKRIIQKNREISPEVFERKELASVSQKPRGKEKGQEEASLRSVEKGRLKKMMSLDNFESQAETRSINLSEFSNELSNVKRRREREQKNREMKEKVQEILLKSKKAIELLKNPKTHK